VDAANLRVQIGNIRRVLGQRGKDVVTEQSLGYSFQGEVRANRISLRRRSRSASSHPTIW
jgi:DNA-binding winged helix-turn-helix (wHTH) protein